MNNKKPSGMDHMLVYTNHYLSTPEGQEIFKKVFTEDHPLTKDLSLRLENHKKVLENMAKLALGDETPLIPPKVAPPPVSEPVKPQFPLGQEDMPIVSMFKKNA